MARLPYEGVKILEVAQGAVCPVCISWFGAWGAEVIHLESHIFIDIMRSSGPMYDRIQDLEHTWWFHTEDTSKYDINLDLRKPKAVELVKRLVTEWKPNIFAESYTPGTLPKLGLGYEVVRELKPDIIYYSTCQQGETGPHKDRPGYGNIGSAVSGMQSLAGWPDRPPVPIGPWSDFTGATLSHFAIAAALIRQKKTGKGMYIDISQQESAAICLGPALMDYFITGRAMQRNGNRIPYAAPHSAFPCKGDDRWVAIAVFTDEEWESFCQVLANPNWTKDARFATVMGRKANEEKLEYLIGEWTINFTAEEVEAMMQRAGVAANVVESNKDYMEDPQVKYVRGIREFDHPIAPKVHVHDTAIGLSKCVDRMFRSPTMGEHNRYVLHDILGLSDDEIADLLVEKVITTYDDVPF